MSKQRLSISIDSELIKAVERTVAQGHAQSVSSWVNDALQLKLEQHRRIEALRAFVSEFEAEHGEITSEEMQMAARRARQRAIVIRGPQFPKRRSTRARTKKR